MNGKKNGQGKFSSGDNEYHFEGIYKDDKRCGGEGKYHYANGDHYSGGWLDDKKSGHGRYTYGEDGSFYEGSYCNDKRHGRGVRYYKDGMLRKQKWNHGARVDIKTKEMTTCCIF
jgi:hypothetical protein